MTDQPNPLSDDDTRAEFSRLRETALREIQVPGVEAAQHTIVRRRRLHAAATGAGLAVVTIAGGAAIALAPSSQQHGTTPPAAGSNALINSATSSNPIPTQSALYAIGREHGSEMQVSLSAKPGLYRFEVVCSGSGTGTVTLTAGQETASAPITCGVPPVRSPVELNLTGQDELALSVALDPGTKLQNMPSGWEIEIIGLDPSSLTALSEDGH